MKKNHRKNLLPTYLVIWVAVALSFSTSQAEEFREFTNTAGSKLQGKVISATDSEVTLKLADGREISGGINFFSKADQDYIGKWLKENPVQIDYDFDVSLSRSRKNKREVNEGSIVSNYEDWEYKITLENRSKNGTTGTEVGGLVLHYNLVKTAKSKGREANQLNRALKPSGRLRVKPGTVMIPDLKYLEDTDLVTKTIPINLSELAPGYYYPDGTKDEQNDDFEGIVIKIMSKGKAVFETTHGSNAVENMKWMAP
ncbi:MAG: hypothetical protein P1U58_19045 [Verrucomicrobiales bacterium]|nr:hypothetical protein [Verrucomicrobiales bacterium]